LKIAFTVAGAPRTKKNSGRIVRARKGRKLLPSKAYENWHKQAEAQAYGIKAHWRNSGAEFPITESVNVTATFYRDALRGDLINYCQALADWLQDVQILDDDKRIEGWDGSRMAIDRKAPRIAVVITYGDGGGWKEETF